MRDVYIVLVDGVIRYVASADTNIRVHVLESENPQNEEELREFERDMEIAERLPRLW